MLNVQNDTFVRDVAVTVDTAVGGAPLTSTLTIATEGSPNRYTINWGDGSSTVATTDSTPSHTYTDNSNSPFDVTVRAYNDTGAGDGELDVTASGGDGDYSYSWSGPDNFTSADEDLTGIASGEYTVVVTDGNGCSTTETFGVPVGIVEWSFLQTVQVSPNPSNGIVNVTLNGATGEDVAFTLFDAQGRNVWSQNTFNALGQVRLVADFQGVANGIYQLQMLSGESRHAVQLIKQ